MKKIIIVIVFVALIGFCIYKEFGNREEVLDKNEESYEVVLINVKVIGEVVVPFDSNVPNDYTLRELFTFIEFKHTADLSSYDLDDLVEERTYFIYSNEPSVSGKISINTATKDLLITLDGIGSATADKIIEYRGKTPFKTIEDIMNVSGIGQSTFDKIKDRITI